MTLQTIKDRLTGLGITVTEADDGLLIYISGKVEKEVKDECGITELPEELDEVATDMVAGEFILSKKDTGQDVGINVDDVVKSLTEGDVTVQFGNVSPEKRLDTLIQYLITGKRGRLVSHRRIQW